jgi:membrane dipeptidase
MGGRLSPFGVEVVKEMNRLGMMVGVSHLSVNGVLHVAEITKHPIVSTHQNLAQYVSSHPPVELVPEEVKAIASTGGVVGVRYDVGQVPYSLMADEIEFLAKSIGVEHIGIAWLGHDVGNPDPYYVPGYTQPQRVFTGPEAETMRQHWTTFIGILAERGFTEQQIGLILGGNYLRAWREVLPD